MSNNDNRNETKENDEFKQFRISSIRNNIVIMSPH